MITNTVLGTAMVAGAIIFAPFVDKVRFWFFINTSSMHSVLLYVGKESSNIFDISEKDIFIACQKLNPEKQRLER